MVDDNLVSSGHVADTRSTYRRQRDRGHRSASEEPCIGRNEKDLATAILRINVLKRRIPRLEQYGDTEKREPQGSNNRYGSGQMNSSRTIRRIHVIRPPGTLDVNSDDGLKRALKLGGAKMLYLMRMEAQVSKTLNWARETFKIPLLDINSRQGSKKSCIDELSRKWFQWAFSLSRVPKVPKVREVITGLESQFNLVLEEDLKDIRSIFKNLGVIMRCDALKAKAAVPILCKLCNQTIRMQDMATHSFKCFERKSIHKELDTVNRMIVRLRATMTKLKTLIRKLLFYSVNPMRVVHSPRKRAGGIGTSQKKIDIISGQLTRSRGIPLCKAESWNQLELVSSPMLNSPPGINKGNTLANRPGFAPFLRSATQEQDQGESSSTGPFAGLTEKSSQNGFSSYITLQSIQDMTEDGDGVSMLEEPDTSYSYQNFAKQNVQNYEIISIYFQDLLTTPYEENLPNDLVVGRWLDTIIPQLNAQLMPMLQEFARFKIDTSVLDIYKNLLILIGKRYELETKIIDPDEGELNALMGISMMMTPSNRLRTPSSAKRRLSRSSNEKKLVLMLKGKIDNDRCPKFLRKKSEDSTSKFLELWQKSASMEQQKIHKMIKGLEYLKSYFDRLNGARSANLSPNQGIEHPSPYFSFGKTNEAKYSAIPLLKSLVKNTTIIEEVTRDRSGSKRVALKASHSREPMPSENFKDDGRGGNNSCETDTSSNFFTNTNFTLKLSADDATSPKQLTISSRNEGSKANTKNGEDPDLLTMGRSRRGRAVVDIDLEVQDSKPEESSFKFKLDSPNDDSNHSASILPTEESTAKLAWSKLQNIPEVREDNSKGSNGSFHNINENFDSPKADEPIVSLVIPSTRKLSEEPNFAFTDSARRVKKMSIEDAIAIHSMNHMSEEPLSPYRAYNRGMASPYSPSDDSEIRSGGDLYSKEGIAGICDDLAKKFKQFDRFIARHKKRKPFVVEQSNQEKVERLVVSDTEYENRMNINKKYQENTQSIGVQDFDFLALLGKGGFGTVWLVKRKVTGDLYAMKLIKFHNKDPLFIESMVNENRIMMSLVGDYAVKGVFSFIHGRYYCVVMDLMVGGDFRKVLDEQTALYEDDAKFYAAELALAVNHIHKQNITHRDLKPENMLLDNKGHLKLADFGLSDRAEAFENIDVTPNVVSG